NSRTPINLTKKTEGELSMKPNKNYYDSLYSKYYDEISEKRRDVKTITRTLASHYWQLAKEGKCWR
ncbi:MAG: hypothetical protein O4805_03455, partial [Trichodesmium sp. St16_bin2-tuft]|nr:hypothetical protein [Trichodesmium sp. St16_bin2-tuft]